DAAHARDPRVALVDRPARALALGTDDHRPELEQVELQAVVADASLPVEHRATVVELDRDRGQREQRARKRQPERGARDVERPDQRVPSAFSQTAGTPKRRYRCSARTVAQVTST